jgi:hypothetical protein
MHRTRGPAEGPDGVGGAHERLRGLQGYPGLWREGVGGAGRDNAELLSMLLLGKQAPENKQHGRLW